MTEPVPAEAAPLPPVTRPDGSVYRPRKLVAYSVTDEDEIITGAIVLGTHDPSRAQNLADDVIRRDLGPGYRTVEPCAVWWRSGYESGRCGWITDERRGRAGVWFRELDEVTQ